MANAQERAQTLCSIDLAYSTGLRRSVGIPHSGEKRSFKQIIEGFIHPEREIAQEVTLEKQVSTLVGEVFPYVAEQERVTQSFQISLDKYAIRQPVKGQQAHHYSQAGDRVSDMVFEVDELANANHATIIAKRYGADHTKVLTWLNSANEAGIRLAALLLGIGRHQAVEDDFKDVLDRVTAAREATGLSEEQLQSEIMSIYRK